MLMTSAPCYEADCTARPSDDVPADVPRHLVAGLIPIAYGPVSDAMGRALKQR